MITNNTTITQVDQLHEELTEKEQLDKKLHETFKNDRLCGKDFDFNRVINELYNLLICEKKSNKKVIELLRSLPSQIKKLAYTNFAFFLWITESLINANRQGLNLLKFPNEKDLQICLDKLREKSLIESN